MSKIWFVTGSSRGFGRQFVEAALDRGDKVVATARNTDSLADLVAVHGESVLALVLDVTDRVAVVEAVKQAHEHFGHLDVVVNNAGCGLLGAVAGWGEQQVRDEFETNFFGALWVVQAVLPILCEQGDGHIVQISTAGGVLDLPAVDGCNASRWALEGLTEALALEVAGFGIKVTLVEPGGFPYDWDRSSAVRTEPLRACAGARADVAALFEDAVIGGPTTAGPALLKIVDAENPPLRAYLDTSPL
ncbi:SDR family NAD(P)-dependent oxidoreductase [Actinosynnema sp. NPDC023794]